MRCLLCCVAVSLALLGFVRPAAAAVGDEKPEFGLTIDTKEDAIKASVEEAGPGDNKAFSIRTDDDLTYLRVGDVYTNGQKTFFRVDSIRSQGPKGGEFTFRRTNGAIDPDRKFTRVWSKENDAPRTIVTRLTLVDLYIMGGPFLHPIAILGACTIALAANSFWLYRRSRQIPSGFVQEAGKLLEQGDIGGFENLALKQRGLLPFICRAMAERFEQSSPEDIRTRCEIAAASRISTLRIPIKALNFIAAVAPLLGLLGTIIGMVIVFEAVASSTGVAKATALAAGIRVKLFATAAALCVAIPALCLFFAFNQQLGSIIAQAEVLAESFMHRVLTIKRDRNGNGAAAAALPEPVLVGAPAPAPVAKPYRIATEVRP